MKKSFVISLIVCFLAIFTQHKAYSQFQFSEIMYAPVNDMPEWIELYYSANDTPMDSIQVTIGDITKDHSVSILPQKPFSFIVIVKDTSLLKKYIAIPDSLLLIEAKLPSLNNTGDSLYLKDLLGNSIDTFFYKGNWAKSGISLERANFNLPADNSTNLVQCKSLDSSTCGMANSNLPSSIDTAIVTDQLIISPNPFSSNSPIKNKCIIKIAPNSKVENIELSIYDINGNLVLRRNLSENYSGTDAIEFQWNGLNENNFQLQAGAYPTIVSWTVVNSRKIVTLRSIIVIAN